VSTRRRAPPGLLGRARRASTPGAGHQPPVGAAIGQPSDDGNVLNEAAVLRDPRIFPVAGKRRRPISRLSNGSDLSSGPYCRKLEPELQQAVKGPTAKVRLVFKDWPILGPGVGSIASRLALATKFQGKFVEGPCGP